MRKAYLDGIRGWAALMVLLSHLVHNFAAQAAPALNKPVLLFPTDGALAVYFFFVVSGFALSTRFVNTGSVRDVTSLAIRRYPRLFIPIAVATAMSFIVWRAGLIFSHQAAPVANSDWWLGTFYNFPPSIWGAVKFATFDVFFAYNSEATYNSAFWTMQVELFGSMLVFGLMTVFAPAKRWPVYLTSFVILLFLKTPMLAFLLGMVAAEIDRQRDAKDKAPHAMENIVGYIGISSVVAFSTFGRGWYDDPRALAFAAFVFVIAVMHVERAQRFFLNRVSQALGKISFPLYLTHMILICSLSSYLYVHWLATGMSKQAASNLMVASTLPAVFLLAWCFYPVESKAIALSRGFSDRLLGQHDEQAAPAR
ncbi:acyltransferase family protein [Paraburkholderia dilworthii]|uniref:Acyltransferase n=1 Tax=Paraburkholderia dilworthii TaxID=948106 RepID=A0ABW9DKA2_9BURK